MRSLRRTSKKQALRSLPVTPQVTESADHSQVESHSEPLGHVHDNYRHWVWLGLHRREG